MTTTVGKTLQSLLKTPVKVIGLYTPRGGKTKTMEPIEWKEHTPLIHCMDGTTLSVQAGKNVYSVPRDNEGPWYKVEVGYPSKHLPQLDEFKDGNDADDPTGCVYGYVPIEVVEEAIASCGGICWEWTLLNERVSIES